jgi:hypothetical protein
LFRQRCLTAHPPPPGARRYRPGAPLRTHVDRTPPPLQLPQASSPTCPSLFLPLLDSETAAPPHGAPIVGRVVAASSSTQVAAPLLSLTVSTGAAPNQAPEAGRLLLMDQAAPTEPPPPCHHARLSVYTVYVSLRSSEPGQDAKLAGEQLPSLSSSHTASLSLTALCSLPMRRTKTEGGRSLSCTRARRIPERRLLVLLFR